MKCCLRVFGLVSLLLPWSSAAAQQLTCSFSFGLVGKNTISLNGNNVCLDSFDSSDPTKSTNGQYDPAKRQPNGNVAAGGSVTNAVNVGNALIYGYVFTSPTGTVTMGPNGSIGPTFSNPATTVPQAVANGWIRSDCSLSVPDVLLPPELNAAPSLGIINSTKTLLEGLYQADSISLSGTAKLTIDGLVILFVHGTVKITDSASIEVAQGGSLVLYAAGDVSIAGSGVINEAGLAVNNRFYGLPSSTSWSIAAATQWIGVVWAPEADLVFSGSGDKSGGFIASSITMDSPCSFHYDESLRIHACSGGPINPDTDGIARIQLVENGIALSFPIAPCNLYNIEFSDDLSTGKWMSVVITNTTCCTNQTIQVTDTGAGDLPQRFYRLRIRPQGFGF